jgi:hypothetical protein
MWYGPTWPHAVSLVADTIARVLREEVSSPLAPRHLAELLRSFARFHCEDGDPARPLLREYGDGETGVNWGCPDYLHSTFCDLVVRHVLGIVPAFGKELAVRPLPLGLGDFAVEDLPYHGHRLAVRIAGDVLAVEVDGREAARGTVGEGVVVDVGS